MDTPTAFHDLTIRRVPLDSIHLDPANARQHGERNLLLGVVTVFMDASVRIEGITLRRTLEGRLALSYPARRDRRGRQHALGPSAR